MRSSSVRTASLTWLVFGLLLAASPLGSEVSTVAVPNGAGSNSGAISLLADGTIYQADFSGTVVRKIRPNGAVSVLADGFFSPEGNAIDAEGYLLQSNFEDRSNPTAPDAISRISPDGTVTEFAGGFNGPVGLTIAADGTVFVAMCRDNSVVRVEADGSSSSVISSGALYACPNGITMDELGDLYVTNNGTGTVIRLDMRDPNAITATEFASIAGGRVNHATYVSGSLYVTANLANQIWRIPMTSKRKAKAPKLLAGDGSRARVDGPNLSASFARPNGIARNAVGSALFTNEDNNAIRKITLDLARPKKPKKLKASVLDNQSVLLTFKHKDRNREGYAIEALIVGESDWGPVAEVTAPSLEVELHGLDPDTEYQFRVSAFNGTASSKASKKVRVSTPQ